MSVRLFWKKATRMKTWLAIIAAVFCCLVLCPWSLAADKGDVSGKLLLFAAASTTEAMDQVRAEFTRLHPGVTVRTSYGASSTLARQIKAGAEADVFLSASTQWSDFLRQQQLVESVRDLLSNQLVVIVPAGSSLEIKTPGDLVQRQIRHLALADPKSVPAGIYAKQALEQLDLWRQLEPKVAGAADVRQAMHFVATGAAEAGIVYATDAAAQKKVRAVLKIDSQRSEPIRYPAVLLRHGAENAAAVAFYEFLASPAAAVIFREHGFIVLPVTANP